MITLYLFLGFLSTPNPHYEYHRFATVQEACEASDPKRGGDGIIARVVFPFDGSVKKCCHDNAGIWQDQCVQSPVDFSCEEYAMVDSLICASTTTTTTTWTAKPL